MGKINVKVQTADRLTAINNLSAAIRDVARALATNVTVNIKNNEFIGGETGITVDTEKEIEKTELIVHEE